MVDFKSLDPKALAEEISQQVKNKQAKGSDVANLLKQARAEMPEEFMEEVDSTLRELAEDMQELKDALRHKSTEGTGAGSSSGSGMGFFSKLNVFAKFVQILKEGGPYSIIAVLVISNAWTMMELQEANNRIIDLLIALRAETAVSEPIMVEPSPIPTPAVKPPLGHLPSPSGYQPPASLPEDLRIRVMKTRDMYQQQVQDQYQE